MTASNTYGRQVVVPLTNKSGGGVIAGDVVVVDTTNNDAFTTNTAGAYTGVTGIAQGTIASNAVGIVLLAGYAALVNVNASVTRGNFGKTHTVAKQATDAGSSRIVGTFCEFLTGGTTPDAHVFGVVDLGTGSGNYTSSILWTSGTSMPGGPATNQRITRTDLGLDFYYDGTRWLTVNEYATTLANLDANQPYGSSPGNDQWGVVDPALSGQWITRLAAWAMATPTNTGSHYWTFQLASRTKAAVAHNIGGTFNTSADTAGEFTAHAVTIAAQVTAADTHFVLIQTKTGSPSNAYVQAIVFYRLIGT